MLTRSLTRKRLLMDVSPGYRHRRGESIGRKQMLRAHEELPTPTLTRPRRGCKQQWCSLAARGSILRIERPRAFRDTDHGTTKKMREGGRSDVSSGMRLNVIGSFKRSKRPSSTTDSSTLARKIVEAMEDGGLEGCRIESPQVPQCTVVVHLMRRMVNIPS